MIRRPHVAAVVAVATSTAGAVTGCAAHANPLDGPVYAAHTCTAEDVLADWWQPGIPFGPMPRTLHETPSEPFEPVAVVLCETGNDLDASDEPTAVLVTEVRYEGDLGAVLDYFAQPSTPRDDSHPDCAAAGAQAPPPVLWLVDADGRATLPGLPTVQCGFYRDGVMDTLVPLDAVDRVEHVLELDPGA
ncbi:hypothetical protein Q9R32_13030 [Actinotalea sp. AC32]|nr:hypothetical protein [Actinotalea sp. AC32]